MSTYFLSPQILSRFLWWPISAQLKPRISMEEEEAGVKEAGRYKKNLIEAIGAPKNGVNSRQDF